MIHRDDLHIRDPFIVVDPAGGYLAISSRFVGDGDPPAERAVYAYPTDDLAEFGEPRLIYRADPACPMRQDAFWAPEVHQYRGRWYLFVTVTGEAAGANTGVFDSGGFRGTVVCVADRPDGPYALLSDGPIVSPDLLTLDGTLFVDRAGRPWMVYCHEWVQTIDGTVEAVPLKDDLSAADGEPILLFRGSDAAWSTGSYTGSYNGRPVNARTYVTDGTFLFYDEAGGLCTLWSSFDKGVYLTGVARSASGRIDGPWEQADRPIFTDDGGHGMLFTTREGQLTLALHQPNSGGMERMKLLPVETTGRGLRILQET